MCKRESEREEIAGVNEETARECDSEKETKRERVTVELTEIQFIF